MKKNLILVTGATGAEGGSVARALLEEDHFAVRIITRNVNSPNARKLQSAGAELIEGDLEDISSLMRAMKNCYGVYGVTSLGVHPNKEYQLGINLIDAVRVSRIHHLVLQTQPDYAKLSSGKYPVPQLDVKADLQRYSQGLKIPATYIQTGLYYEEFFSLFTPDKKDDGTYYFGFPQGDAKLSMTSVEDLGGVVATVFNHPSEYTGRTVIVVGSDETGFDYARKMSKVFYKNIQYQYIPRETYIARGLLGGEGIANMFEVQRLYTPERQINLIESYGLNPKMQSFQSWILKNREKLNRFFKSVRVAEEI